MRMNFERLDMVMQSLPNSVKTIIEQNDCLGFCDDCKNGVELTGLEQAVIAIMEHDDFPERWEITGIGEEPYILPQHFVVNHLQQWRTDIANKVN